MSILVLGGGKSGTSAKKYLEQQGKQVELFDKKIEYCVVSPGIKVVSELDLAPWRLCDKIVAITGTNGKSSVVKMIAQVLGERGVLCGNIGIPVTSVAKELKGKIAVVEVSSFQLEIPPRNFKPDISVILNISTDHLDRHGTMEDYIRCKKRIRGKIHFEYISNEDAVLKVCTELGYKETHIKQVVKEYMESNKEHRIEFVTEYNGVKFYNDSKATNIASTLYACEKINQDVNLIIGGVSKVQNFTELIPNLPSHVKNVFVIGQATEEIFKAVKDKARGYFKCKDLSDAVELAYDMALENKNTAGVAVLLSPACSSFDMFNDFEHRGREFKSIVIKLTTE